MRRTQINKLHASMLLFIFMVLSGLVGFGTANAKVAAIGQALFVIFAIALAVSAVGLWRQRQKSASDRPEWSTSPGDDRQ